MRGEGVCIKKRGIALALFYLRKRRSIPLDSVRGMLLPIEPQKETMPWRSRIKTPNSSMVR